MKRVVLALYALLLLAACELSIDANLPDSGLLTKCTENPCRNGGLCESLVFGIRCVCPPGYSGQLCETKETECQANSCQNGGTCVQGDGSYTCTCAAGYQGDHCELSECALMGACLHGTCDGAGGCTCGAGWQGSACDQNVNECVNNNPCLHAGQCNDIQGGFTCTCATGYDGVVCGQCATGYQDDDNDGTCCATGYAGAGCASCETGYTRVSGLCQRTCASTQTDCGTHGTCSDAGGQVACSCETGYFGVLCDSLMGSCTSEACSQHGSCSVTSETTFKCACNAGYTGRQCEVVDDCVAGAPQGGPCSGHGSCVDGNNAYTCTCDAGWIGMTCAELDNCVDNMCQHGGTCIDGDNAYTCDCTGTNYEGQYCESKINFCATAPCKNGGACTDGATTFSCDCTGTGFTGPTCQTDLDECADVQADVCQTGTCINGGSGEGYACRCPDGTIDVDGDGTNCSSVVSLAAGALNTCAITAAGTLHCWGDNASGQLAQGNNVNPSMTEIRAPKRVGSGTGWQKVSVGGAHVCGIRSGHLYCWGNDVHKQVGGATGLMERSPLEPRPDLTWTDVSLGEEHTCALAGTALYCWGNSADSQAGTPAYGTYVDAPKQIAGTWNSVSAGAFHTCAIDNTNALTCWGDDSGQLGGAQPIALPVDADGSWSSVKAGQTHTCAIAGTHTYCWGAGTKGALGNGMFANANTPVQVSSGLSLESLAAGEDFSCALVDDIVQSGASQIYCWGSNEDSRLLTADVQVSLPQLVNKGGSTAWTAYAVGPHHMCGVDAGLLYCWGSNADGAVGGAAPDSIPVGSARLIGNAPVPHSSTDHCTPNQCKNGGVCMNTGSSYTCNCDGTGFTGPTCTTETNECLTSNICGQGTCLDLLGGGGYGCACPDGLIDLDNTGTTCLSAAAISAGYNHTCALTTANTLHCWGSNRYGQFGLGAVGTQYYGYETSQSIRTPLRIKTVAGISANNASGWTNFGVGESHTCATIPNTTGSENLYCWGNNAQGQLGRAIASATDTEAAPYLLDGTHTWTALSVGYAHNCGISGGQLYCWGYNPYGQVGNGTQTSPALFSLTPVALPVGEASWISVAAGGSHTCAITNTNTTYCWGRQQLGQTGQGATSTTPRTTPGKTSKADPQGFTAIQADINHVCGLVGTSGYCWGLGVLGGIGDGGTTNRPAPTLVSGGLAFSRLTLGQNYGCGLVAVNGSSPQAYTLSCWGNNAKNILLDNSKTQVNAPQAVLASRQWRVVDAGPLHMCGVDDSDGKLYCWGDNGLEGGVGQGKLGTQPYSSLGNFDIGVVKARMATHAAP
ncbi:MAG TPA: hypothetical protein VFN67_06855 [Polyangiales bacterium]|nr:hypothetical protein [Polyangiales bacterium]